MPAAATARRDSRRRRHERTRARIVETALRLSGHRPFKDLTVDEIARGAGVSRTAFYIYFGDKGELLLAAVEELAQELFAEAERWWRGDGDPEELVREAVSGVVIAYAKGASVLRVATEVSTYDDEVGAFWLALMERFIAATEEQIRSEQQRGRVSEALDARATAEALNWMTERCCYVFLARGERSPQALIETLTGVWLSTLYGRPAGRPAGPGLR
ncbi:MAG: TetR/AcrR family transcriptional regulator [Solirubrobacterales bacterium]